MTTSSSAIRFDYTRLETVIQGADASAELQDLVARTGSRRVFMLASRTLREQTEIIDTLEAGLGERCAGVFAAIPAHTPRSAVMQAIAQARAAQADLLVSVGGGSVIDCAKVVQLALSLGIETEAQLVQFAQFADGTRGEKAGDFSLFGKGSSIRQVAIPTTLSGAEFSNNAGVTDTQKSLKEGYRGPDLCPMAIFYDPALSRQTPQWLWLSTAVRSLDHAIEGYCSADAHPFLEGHFLQAMRLFASALPATCRAPEDLQARSLCQQAVWLACCGLGQVRHGASHGIGYLLGAVCGVPHGHTSCVMLPAVLKWNASLNGSRQQAVAAALGQPQAEASQAVRALISAIGMPVTLPEVGVTRAQLPRIAELASRHPVVRRNPRPITSAQDVLEILELAWS